MRKALGADGGSRTRTAFRPQDFKSLTYNYNIMIYKAYFLYGAGLCKILCKIHRIPHSEPVSINL